MKIELKSLTRKIKSEYSLCKTPQDYIDNGADETIIKEIFSELNKKVSPTKMMLLQTLDDIWDIEEAEEEWFLNPGGIPGNVLKHLPRFLLIPTDTSAHELHDKRNGVLCKTLNELFVDVRNTSDNYKTAQKYLDELEKEMDPNDEDSDFGRMLSEINTILSNVFPESKLYASADLSDPNKVLSPSFNIEMSSNVRTEIKNQGTGMIRSAVFGILRYRQKWLSKREDDDKRSLIIAFEEPENFLHPSAANQMRDTIYELSGSESQIVAATHSPCIIDLSRKPKQVLNRFSFKDELVEIHAFNVTEAFSKLIDDDKTYVKMLLKIDDYVARLFFTRKIVIVEGDTEDIVIRETLKRLPETQLKKIKSDFEIINARGKGTIIGLIKYLRSMKIIPIAVHDRDSGIPGAERFNRPIAEAMGGSGEIIQFHECIEDELGYATPDREKPYVAYIETQKWGDNWDDIPDKWKLKMMEIFNGYID